MDDRSTLHKGIEPDDEATNTSGKEFGTTLAVLARTTVTGGRGENYNKNIAVCTSSHADDRTIKMGKSVAEGVLERRQPGR